MIPFRIFAACICFVLVLAGTAVYLYRRHTRSVLREVVRHIEDAISGKYQEPVYNESMDSAIQEKLNQFLHTSVLVKERTEEERDTIKALISDISHQIRTPLANIRLYAELLGEQPDIGGRYEESAKQTTVEHMAAEPSQAGRNPGCVAVNPEQMAEESEQAEGESARMVRQIQDQAEKLEFFMKELLRSSYLETEMIEIHAQAEPVDEIVRRAMQQAELPAMKKEIVLSYQDSGFTCYADRKWTIEAVANLLDNAVKYSPERSEVTVSVIPFELFLRIDVKDEGIGIAEEDQGLIFRRFYRAAGAAQEKGLGIGLYLAREIISKQGGYIKVSSEQGKGSVFSVFLSKRGTGELTHLYFT